ncbi:LysR family transcriptional regulator [Pseudoalteromonas piratica]|uniref:LysR family transcriptional regulator n=1 Tax=Pseudoalteromonas piratica TaxID=1348114 RepID=A0A0A7ELM4_9GAMM|nr:LysR family transcriptional regulator [Pseudoalteromonas piratica]AIY67529.1 LysR family transcriptional regulator [Pseudoalteromonas piratica]
MDWAGVSEFVAVAETQSFTAAASKQGVSVVYVSRKVNALEQRLGVKLLKRTTRKVSLTEMGQQFYYDCKPLVEGLAQAELNVSNIQHGIAGQIRVTAPVTYGERYIAPLVNAFLALHANIEIDLILTNQKLDLIDGGIDIAIRLGHLSDSNLIAKKLATRQMFVCASPKYIEKYGEPHTLSELNLHQCLVGSNNYWRFLYQGKARNLRVTGRLKCNSGVSLLDAAISGLGLAQLPDYYVGEALKCGDLVEVLPSYRDKEEGIWALYGHNRALPSKLDLFIRFLQENIKKPA